MVETQKANTSTSPKKAIGSKSDGVKAAPRMAKSTRANIISLSLPALCIVLVAVYAKTILVDKSGPASKMEATTSVNQNARPSPPASNSDSISHDGKRLITPEELSRHDANATKIWLAILGEVFDVTEGQKYYGDGGGYNFFAGIDASRAFVTGEFNETGLKASVGGLTSQQIADVHNWLTFYRDHEKYTFVGLLVGVYYDDAGRPTDELSLVETKVKEAKEAKENEEAVAKKYPNCNMRWAQDVGGEVWCEDPSLVPRRAKKQGGGVRCACYSKEDAENLASSLELYAGCNPGSQRCQTPP